MRRSPLLVLIVLLALVGFATGCGTSGGNEATKTSTSADDSASSSDDKSDDASDDGDQSDDSSTPTSASTEDLKAILPTLDDLDDPDYVDEEVQLGADDTSDESDDSSDQEIEDACPGISELEFFDDTQSDDDDSVSVTFSADDQREVEVRLDPTATALTEDNLDKAIEVLNDCGEVSLEEDGTEMTMYFHAERDDSFGDHGLRLEMQASFDYLGMGIDLEFIGRAFWTDGVGVFVSASSGFEESDSGMPGDAVPLDEDHIDAMSELMVERVGSL